MKNTKILDHRFFIRLDFDHSLKANIFFQTNPQNRENLANQLLLYDEIVIPTKDFGIVPIIINWFGLKLFIEALENNTFSFLHTNSLLGYGGNGLGISGFTITDGGKLFKWWQDAMFRDSSIAVEQQLKNMCPFISKTERERIVLEILNKNKEVEYNNDFFMKNIVHETYHNDIEKNEEFCKYIIEDVPKSKDGTIHLEKLPGIDPNQMRALNQEGKIENSIDLVLRIAEINMELYMATIAEGADLLTSEGTDVLIKNKLIRSGIAENNLDNFMSLLVFRDIPNIGRALALGDYSFAELWKTRQKKNAIEFRNWIRNAEVKNSEELIKLYVDMLEKKNWIDSLPSRILKFVITNAASVLFPPAGLALDVVNNFFLDEYLKGYSPKLFMDDLSKIKF